MGFLCTLIIIAFQRRMPVREHETEDEMKNEKEELEMDQNEEESEEEMKNEKNEKGDEYEKVKMTESEEEGE